jgi:hypothetical protein
MMRELPDTDLLRYLFQYEPDTGRLVWRNPRARNIRPGTEAGCVAEHGTKTYRVVNIAKKIYLAHRVIWAMTYGAIGRDEIIDHIDQDGLNNRLQNMRIAGRRLNAVNARIQARNTSGVKGVTWCKTRERWLVQFVLDGKTIYRKRFTCLDEAIQVRRDAEKRFGYEGVT